VRGAVEHHYRAKARPQVSAEAWAAAPPIAKQAAVGSSLQMIDEYTRAAAAAGGFDSPEATLARSGLRLDREGWEELGRAYGRWLDEMDAIETAAAERMERDHGDDEAIVAGAVLMLFEAISIREAVAVRTQARRRRAAEQLA
jgi:hypothetical protein